MNLESLYPLVTEAIRRAEMLDDLGAPGASAAHLDVSLIEEKIAELLPASNPEGAVARRGAVRAALAAKEFARAQALAVRFIAQKDSAPELRAELASLEQEGERVTAKRDQTRFPRVSKRYGIAEIRRLARALIQQGAPFPIG